MDSKQIGEYFEQFEWAAEEVEQDIWRSTFTTEAEEDFDLYVMVADEWFHFAVSPLAHLGKAEEMPKLTAALLRLNQRMQVVRLSLDDEGDLNLVADAPRQRFDYGDFSLILELLVEYTSALAYEVRRSIENESYFSPLLPTA
jgi:hypothetical protein